MQGEHIDGSALAANGEGRFYDRLPAHALETFDNGLHEPGVGGVEEAIQALASPTNADVHRRTERLADPAKGPDLHIVDSAGLDFGNELSRDMNNGREILLAPPFSNSQRAVCTTDSHGIHAGQDEHGHIPRDHLIAGQACRRPPRAYSQIASGVERPPRLRSRQSSPRQTP
jgi:hypothetical protein